MGPLTSDKRPRSLGWKALEFWEIAQGTDSLISEMN